MGLCFVSCLASSCSGYLGERQPRQCVDLSDCLTMQRSMRRGIIVVDGRFLRLRDGLLQMIDRPYGSAFPSKSSIKSYVSGRYMSTLEVKFIRVSLRCQLQIRSV
ncbi:hypothetical protein ElyMa_003132400 [Elysia marginata]|uniref:Secreted protein n=1 Tax=Elysia marginata TaxID=1093978 RepID=A0AAV4IWV4_9GAST|nr:hypothetical protein ElyMa_003132400 [Elysia marginata]